MHPPLPPANPPRDGEEFYIIEVPKEKK